MVKTMECHKNTAGLIEGIWGKQTCKIKSAEQTLQEFWRKGSLK